MTPEALLADLARLAREAAPEELPRLRAVLAEADSIALARIMVPAATNHQEEDRLLNMPEVANILGIPVDRAYDLGRQRAFPVVTIGKYRRVRLSAIKAFVAAHEEKTLDRSTYVTYSKLRDRSRGAANPKGPRAHAGATRRATRGGDKQRRAVGASGDGHPPDGREAVAAAGRAEER